MVSYSNPITTKYSISQYLISIGFKREKKEYVTTLDKKRLILIIRKLITHWKEKKRLDFPHTKNIYDIEFHNENFNNQ